MVELKKIIGLVTFLLFIYNALFTYIVIKLTSGPSQFVFLMLLVVDYLIIFYFVLQVTHEMKFSKAVVGEERQAKPAARAARRRRRR